jgi:hypothetical protein
MPAAHTVSSLGMTRPLAVVTPPAAICVTRSWVNISTRSELRRACADSATRSGNAGRMREPASMIVSFTSRSGTIF